MGLAQLNTAIKFGLNPEEKAARDINQAKVDKINADKSFNSDLKGALSQPEGAGRTNSMAALASKYPTRTATYEKGQADVKKSKMANDKARDDADHEKMVRAANMVYDEGSWKNFLDYTEKSLGRDPRQQAQRLPNTYKEAQPFLYNITKNERYKPAAPAKVRQPGETRSYQKGDRKITEEWDGDKKQWVELAKGPNWEKDKPKYGTQRLIDGNDFVDVPTVDGRRVDDHELGRGSRFNPDSNKANAGTGQISTMKAQAMKAYLAGEASNEQKAIINVDKDPYVAQAIKMVNDDLRLANKSLEEKTQIIFDYSDKLRGQASKKPDAPAPARMTPEIYNQLRVKGLSPEEIRARY